VALFENAYKFLGRNLMKYTKCDKGKYIFFRFYLFWYQIYLKISERIKVFTLFAKVRFADAHVTFNVKSF